MRQLARDARYAWRGLRRAPLFTLVAVSSIALGVGANTALFTLVDEVILGLLPVPHPDELVLFSGPRNHYGSNSGGNMLSFPMYEDFRDNFVDNGGAAPLTRVSAPVPNPAPTPKIFTGLFARRPIAMNVGVEGQTERVTGDLVSGTYFSVLGVGAAIGRVITPDDDKARDGAPVAVLAYDYWRSRFAADRTVVGRPIVVNNTRLTIIGVSAPGYAGLDISTPTSLFVPVMLKAAMTPGWDDMDNRRSRWVNVFGRMAPGVARDRALAAIQPFFHGLLEQEVQMAPFSGTTEYTRDEFLKGQVVLLSGAQGRAPLRQQLTQPLYLLFGIVGGVLLIACANVASLLIARATGRQKEIAVRLALGATRARIVTQLLVESVMLASIGGALGLAIAAFTARFLIRFLPTTVPSLAITGAIDSRALAFTLAVSLATGLLFGLVPALRATRPDLAPTLKDQAGAVVGGGVTLRKVLVTAQVAISVLLLVGAGLFIRTLRNLRVLDLGLDTARVAAFNINPALSGYTTERSSALYKTLAERLQAQPGVRAVALANIGLLEGSEWDSSMSLEGYEAKPGENMSAYCNAVSPGYFKAMGIAVVRGREFDARDETPVAGNAAPDAPNDGRGDGYSHVVVNESFAKHYYGEGDPIGRHIGFGSNPGTPTPIEIVGVVRDSKYTGVRDDFQRTVFFPLFEQRDTPPITVYVRTAGEPALAFEPIRRTLHDLDPMVPVYNLRTLAVQIDRSLFVERAIAALSSAFGVLATLLAMMGLYGVMAYAVARRTREIGVRMALGAGSGDVVWLVMREVLGVVGVGVAVGLLAALAVHGVVGNALFGVSATDPVSIAGATAVLVSVALLAGYLPARRAARVSPTRALRYE